MALAQDQANRKIAGCSRLATRVANTQVVFGGSYLGLRGPTFATVADRGLADVWDAAAGSIPLGAFADRGVTGDTAASPPPEAEASVDGTVLLAVSVTGASAVTDHGAYVYFTDDDTLTLTRPAGVGMPHGVVSRYITGTLCNVYLFSYAELLLLAAGGSAYDTMYLGSIDLSVITPNDPGGGTVDLRTGITMPCRGRVLDFYAMVDIATVGATSPDIYELTLEIDGTDVTGGQVDVADGLAIGARVDDTAITAANNFGKGSLLDVQVIRAVAADNLTAGRVDLFIEYEKLPGI